MFRRFNRMLNGDSGLSLIEVIVAVTIMSVICLGIYTTFVQGLKLWKRSTGIAPEIDTEIIYEKISHDVRNAAGRQVGFQGDKKGFRFLVGQGLPVENSEVNKTLYEPAFIKYVYDTQEKKMFRHVESLRNYLFSAGKENREQVIGEGMTAKFEYYHIDKERKAFQWKDFWREEKCMPEAVRLSLSYDDASKINRYARIIHIPAGGRCAAPVR